MKLQTKVVVSIVPIVALSIAALGMWAIRVSTDAIERSAFRYMEHVLKTYIADNVDELYQLLVDHRLESETALVKDYQQRAVASAQQLETTLETGRFMIINSFGGVLLPRDDTEMSSVADTWKHLMNPLFQGTKTALAGHIHFEQYGGYVYVAHYFAPWQWGIAYIIPDKEVHAAQWSIRNVTLGIVGGCIVVATGLIFIVFQVFIVRPIMTLQDAASAIARGEKVTHIAIRSPDELGELTRNMEKMAGAIARYHEEQQASQKSLEAQVQERTRALQESEERYRTIFDTVPESLFIADVEGNLVEVNKTACRQYQYSRAELLTMHASQVITPAYHAQFKEFMTTLQQNQSFLGETVDIRKDGTTFQTEVHGTLILFRGTPHLMAVIRDVTERKQAEQQLQAYAVELREKNEELSQYASIISHDLQTPLRGIRNYADFLSEDLDAVVDAEQQRYLDGLKHAVQDVTMLIQDWLILTKIGRSSREFRAVAMSSFLHTVLTELELPHDVEIHMQESWPTVRGDPVLLKQVFQHLIVNGIKFNHSSPKRVALGWQAGTEPETIECFVQDNGIGIPPQYQERIFHVFERLHPKDEFEGTGIGLAVVKKALGKLGGTIRVESTPGKGSTFFVTLAT